MRRDLLEIGFGLRHQYLDLVGQSGGTKKGFGEFLRNGTRPSDLRAAEAQGGSHDETLASLVEEKCWQGREGFDNDDAQLSFDKAPCPQIVRYPTKIDNKQVWFAVLAEHAVFWQWQSSLAAKKAKLDDFGDSYEAEEKAFKLGLARASGDLWAPIKSWCDANVA